MNIPLLIKVLTAMPDHSIQFNGTVYRHVCPLRGCVNCPAVAIGSCLMFDNNRFNSIDEYLQFKSNYPELLI